MIYLSDMSRCRPDSALSDRLDKDSWTLISYETEEVSGTLVSAFSFINAPELTLSLGVSGWHEVYVGYWNPFYPSDVATFWAADHNRARLWKKPAMPFRKYAPLCFP